MNDNTNKNLNIYAIISLIVILLVAGYFLFWNKSDMSDDMGTNTPDSMEDENINTGSNTNTNTGGNTGANTGSNTGATNNIMSDSMIMAMVNIAKVSVPTTGTDVALSNGMANLKIGSKDAEVRVGSIIGKYPTEDGYDVLVNMSLITDKAAKTVVPTSYVALFHVKGNTATFTSAVSIGTNIIVKSADAKADPSVTVATNQIQFDSVKGYDVIVNYLDRKTGEVATVTPTVSKDLAVNVKRHIITR